APEEKDREGLLARAALGLRTDDASIAQLHALRASYEPYVHALSSFLLMPLPDWVPHARESALARDELAEAHLPAGGGRPAPVSASSQRSRSPIRSTATSAGG